MQAMVGINKVTGDLFLSQKINQYADHGEALNQGYDKKNLPTYMIRKSVKPAVEVFQQFEDVSNDIELPEDARNYLN